MVIGDGLFWYRKRRLSIPGDELAEEIAGFPHMDLDEARLFSCGISWAVKDKGSRKPIDSVDLHDRGGRARFRTPDGRDLQLELHGRDWPLSEGRESLVLILTDGKTDSEPIASSWTSLNAARVGHRHRLARHRLRAGRIRNRRTTLLARYQSSQPMD